jgi:hypothetical protein
MKHDPSWGSNILLVRAAPVRVGGVLHGVDTVWTDLEYYGGHIKCTYVNASFGWNIQQGTWEGLLTYD